MLIQKNDIIINKTKFFSIFLINILKKYINGLKINKNQINILTNVTQMLYIITFLKNNSISYFDKLIDIIIVDHISNINRFEINYIFWNMLYEYRFVIRIFTDGFKIIYTLSNFYKSALWLEREIWDMYGIKFLFHVGLRRILTDYSFKGHPLRKDFPLSGYVDVYFDDSTQSIKIAPMELSQSLRFFKFENPWNKWYI
jgi:NADH:ubiquinone oxidoreductase subunit C